MYPKGENRDCNRMKNPLHRSFLCGTGICECVEIADDWRITEWGKGFYTQKESIYVRLQNSDFFNTL